jgi:predicted small metal-binding protein
VLFFPLWSLTLIYYFALRYNEQNHTTHIHDPVCTHTMYGETEEELLKNAKEHGIKEHGYTEETWNEKMSKDQEKFKNLIKSS